ncbi:phage tail protein [Macromonas nakdongensis]|uniref:phage tail protein n=1 Tax=Macromonas nakdongensis TaxID=1843082 RepID=UPI000C3458D7|nr:phage tail protein [Macromonas nakdongensis]
MAVLAVAAAGAWAGSALITGTVLGMSGAAWGWMAGSMLGNALFAPDAEGPRLGDLRVTGSEYGQPIPWVAGSPRIAGQIVWASNKRETANTQSAKGGPEQTTYTYDCDLLILLTENEIAGVSRIWSNGELVFGSGLGNLQGMDGDLPTSLIKSGVCSGIRIYTGTDDQLPDPTYEAAVGAGNAPAYRGRGYVVITGLQLGGGGQIPNLTFEIGASPVDEYFDQVQLLLHFESVGGNWLYDSSSYHRNPTSIGIAEQSDSSIQFGKSGKIGTIASAYDAVVRYDLPVVNGRNLCIEFTFHNPHDLEYSNGSRLLQLSQNGAARLIIDLAWYDIDDGCRVVYYINGTPQYAYGYVSNPAQPVFAKKGMTHKMAIQYDAAGNQTRFYVDGAYIGGLSGNSITTDGYILYLAYGGLPYANPVWFLYDEIRVTHGVRYGAADYTLSAEPFPDAGGAVYASTLPGHSDNLMQRAGYVADDYLIDAEAGGFPLRALAVGQVGPTRATLDMLQSAYFVEVSKSDKIYIRPRAVDPVATIPWADLGASEDAVSDAEPLALTMANDLEIPGQIALSYPNMAGDYQTATEHSDRLLSGQESVQAMQMPLGMLPAEAKALADALLFDQVAGMTKTSVRLPLRYAYIEPGDVIEAVNFDGRSYRLRVQVKRDTLSIIELDCVLDDVGALDSAAVTDTGYISTAEPVRVAPTVFEALDIPLLRDADNSPGYYVAVGADRLSAADEWKGAMVARSWDDTSYAELFRTANEGVLATCSTTLGDWAGGNTWDESNTLTVVTSGGELASSTRSAMQADETLNVLAVGSQATGWELLRFRRAELTAPNTYVLSGFLRGFRGTEWRMGSHAAGEQAVLLDAALRRATSQTSQIGLARYIKAVTFGQILANVDGEAFTDTGEALRPWAPAHPVALADDDGDLVLTWQRRTRLSHRYDGDSPAVPLGEAAELYRVRVYDGATLVRTATATEPTYLYTAAEQAADGFASSDPVIFEICQVSETVGAGRPAICTGVAP